MIAFEGNVTKLKPVEYWVRDRGDGYSDVSTEYGVLRNCDNEFLIPAMVEMALRSETMIVHLPDRPLSREPSFWQRVWAAIRRLT